MECLEANCTGERLRETEHNAELKTNVGEIRTMVQALEAVCKCTGCRFVKYIPRVVPLLLELSGSKDDDELHESCIQVASYIKEIVRFNLICPSKLFAQFIVLYQRRAVSECSRLSVLYLLD